MKSVLPQRLLRAMEAYDKAIEARNKAMVDYNTTVEAVVKTAKACDKAIEAYNKEYRSKENSKCPPYFLLGFVEDRENE